MSMNAQRNAAAVAALKKITPQQLAGIQLFVERQRVQKLAKSTTTSVHVWGGAATGWPTPSQFRKTP
ncbi:hypothetical protein [Rhodanobacter thiooxydans]|uniref:hypothetical protein n=1 Tax=Rhodanobacter thiooxydans TaxID=416169 RepID=UPI00131F0600|nr:hypothetical protein [Rhodanobacter thiooxydans]